ncbi:MAG: hypothetical protein OEX02_07835 [Cyclobacteriaceae bacterium]|nr:hypothetical protein [Cyclobacteriaceae bacterium]
MGRLLIIYFFLLLSISCREKEYWHFDLIDQSGTPYQFIRVKIQTSDKFLTPPYQVRINNEMMTACYHDYPNDQWVFRISDKLGPGEYDVELWKAGEKLSTAEDLLSVSTLDPQKSWMPYSSGDVVDCGIIVDPAYPLYVNDTLRCIAVENIVQDTFHRRTWGYLFDTKNQVLYTDCSPQYILAAFNLNVGDSLFREGEGMKWWLTPEFKTDTMMKFKYSNDSTTTFVKGVGCLDCNWL